MVSDTTNLNLFERLLKEFEHDLLLPCKLYSHECIETNIIQVQVASVTRNENFEKLMYEFYGNLHLLLGQDDKCWTSFRRMFENPRTGRTVTGQFTLEMDSKAYNIIVPFTQVLEITEPRGLEVKDIRNINVNF